MAAWKICLQDGGNAKQTKRKQKQRRIYILRLQCRIYLLSSERQVTVRQFNVWRQTLNCLTVDRDDNAQRLVTAFRPINEAARSWSCDKDIYYYFITHNKNNNCKLKQLQWTATRRNTPSKLVACTYTCNIYNYYKETEDRQTKPQKGQKRTTGDKLLR